MQGYVDMVVALSEKGRMLLFALDEIKEMARGRGVVLMSLDANEKMTAAGFSSGKTVTVIGKSRSGKEKLVTVSGVELKKHILHRARKGCLLPGSLTPLRIK
jgi:topoisomerase-4 subunit A